MTYSDYNISPNYRQPGESLFYQSINSSGGSVTFTGSGGDTTISMWIIPPGVAPITGVTRTATSQVYENPACDPATYGSGWYTRTGGEEDDPSGWRQLVILWDGVVIVNTETDTVTVNPFDGTITKDGWTYEPSTHRGSVYGWAANGTDCGQQSSPSGDNCNAFDVIRY